MDKKTEDVIKEAVERLVADCPPLTEETRAKLKDLLSPDQGPPASRWDDMFPAPDDTFEEPPPFSPEQIRVLTELFSQRRQPPS